VSEILRDGKANNVAFIVEENLPRPPLDAKRGDQCHGSGVPGEKACGITLRQMLNVLQVHCLGLRGQLSAR